MIMKFYASDNHFRASGSLLMLGIKQRHRHGSRGYFQSLDLVLQFYTRGKAIFYLAIL